MDRGWIENKCNPGGSWLYYDEKGDNRAIVYYADWTHGRYEWRLARGWLAGGDLVGWSSTLAEAQRQVEWVMWSEDVKKTVQLTLF